VKKENQQHTNKQSGNRQSLSVITAKQVFILNQKLLNYLHFSSTLPNSNYLNPSAQNKDY
jgi:hypothetical protein